MLTLCMFGFRMYLFSLSPPYPCYHPSQARFQPHYRGGVWFKSCERLGEVGQAAGVGHGWPGAVPICDQELLPGRCGGTAGVRHSQVRQQLLYPVHCAHTCIYVSTCQWCYKPSPYHHMSPSPSPYVPLSITICPLSITICLPLHHHMSPSPSPYVPLTITICPPLHHHMSPSPSPYVPLSTTICPPLHHLMSPSPPPYVPLCITLCPPLHLHMSPSPSPYVLLPSPSPYALTTIHTSFFTLFLHTCIFISGVICPSSSSLHSLHTHPSLVAVSPTMHLQTG